MDSPIPSLFVGEGVSADYALHRHSYSDEIFQFISDYCRKTIQDLDLAVDVGCGPGNSTVGFTKHFKQVRATLTVDVGCGPGNSTVGFTKYFK
ncbi:ubiquinone/menaquinone biosynthesis methyltransferase [Elysia marginata]|uniref:Ubiquinone/menaquinone biosynthesis methyltransferase n=1 Tax=Elysia marginata TaxID=1093978 RepID=A0AAV4FEG8_9GAST|nr:ubiquinone/menaquinone biosynthesis methyltransferase [Elysia marginata]